MKKLCCIIRERDFPQIPKEHCSCVYYALEEEE